MAWTAPMTAVANTALTAAQWNANVRDNFGETAPGKATTAGRYFATTGVNAIAERVPSAATVATSQNTTSTSYTDLATVGPAVTVTTGPTALVFIAAGLFNDTTDAGTLMSVAVTGATAVGASDAYSIVQRGVLNTTRRTGIAHLFTGLTPGSNTFTAKYRAQSNTAGFADREIVVLPF